MTTHETHPGPTPNHPPLHANNSAFLRNAEILFYLARGYEQSRSIVQFQNLSLNLNSIAHVWDWTMELCPPNNDRVNNHTVYALIQSYITYHHTLHTLRTIIHYIQLSITYNHTLHTLHTITRYIHCIQSYITYIIYYHTLRTVVHYIHYIRMQVIQYVAITRSPSY